MTQSNDEGDLELNDNVWDNFFNVDCLNVLAQSSDADDVPKKEQSVTKIELVCSILRQLLPLTQNNGREFVVELLSLFERILFEFINNITQNNPHYSWNYLSPSRIATLHFQNVPEQTLRPGRPKLSIPASSLLYLRESGYSWKQIAEMFLVSQWTILRRAREYGLSDVGRFSNICDDELNRIVLEFFQEHSNFVGFSLTYGYLISIGIKVQHRRLKNCIREIDPHNSTLRYALVVSRRSYSVRGPNSLWHVDGHHSLVTWGFVIHGGIDGYSRLIVYLLCATNNYSETVLGIFSEATSQYGIPSRVRSDHGGENVLLWEFMEEVRGRDRGSAIRGTSTQNQRIERLWRDVFRVVCVNFYYIFHTMETSGILDRNNDVHMFVLHYIFLPRINRSIDSFVAAWNNHPLRTEHNWSPNRIWLNGNIDVRNRYLNTVRDLILDEHMGNDDLEWYGYDPGAPSPDNELPHVVVDNVENLPVNVLAELQTIDPLQPSDSMGIDLFLNSLQRIQNIF